MERIGYREWLWRGKGADYVSARRAGIIGNGEKKPLPLDLPAFVRLENLDPTVLTVKTRADIDLFLPHAFDRLAQQRYARTLDLFQTHLLQNAQLRPQSLDGHVVGLGHLVGFRPYLQDLCQNVSQGNEVAIGMGSVRSLPCRPIRQFFHP